VEIAGSVEFFEELKKRNVFRVAAFYVGVAWLILQLADVVLPAFDVPSWGYRALFAVLLAGFFVAVVLAWLFELTVEGIKREDVARAAKIKPILTGRHMDFVVIGILITALGVSLYANMAARQPAAVKPHEPVSVLVADFDNQTGDPVFQGALEQVLTVGLEGAPFITSFARPNAMKVATQLDTSASKLDPETARLVAVREGIKVVLTGTVAPDSDGYEISVEAVEPTDGSVLTEAAEHAKSKADVLTAMGSLAGHIREGLGDESIKGHELAPQETFTAASLEAVQSYTQAQELARAGRDEDAIAQYQRAVEADPEFARAYSGWALSAFELGRRSEATEKWNQALALLDRMTERERYRTLGLYYMVVSQNYEKAIENYEQLVRLYPADGAGHNNLSVAYFVTLQLDKAVEESRRVLEIYPRNTLYRANYALNAMWAGDMETADAEAARVLEQEPSYYKAYLVTAAAALMRSDLAAAKQAYEHMAATGTRGASLAAMGLADIAMFEGDAASAERIVGPGIVEDRKSGDELGVGTKTIVVAEAMMASGRTREAVSLLDKLPMASEGDGVRVLAAAVYVRAGRPKQAAAIAASLGGQLSQKSRAYGKLIDALIAMRAGHHVEAVETLRASIDLEDLWFTRYTLGQVYLAAGYPAEASAEFDTASKRRTEAIAMFFDDVPTWRHTAELPQWTAKASQALAQPPAGAAPKRP
jgi:tetratricopeptide (TPR) repeat protein